MHISDNQFHLLLGFLYSLIELWMGKNSFKANSIPELIGVVIKGVFLWILNLLKKMF